MAEYPKHPELIALAGRAGRQSAQNIAFTIETVDLPTLLQLVEIELSALTQYENWIGRFGHQSIATAEGLADALNSATTNLSDEVVLLRRRYDAASEVDSGIFVVLKSLEEVIARIQAGIPNDPDISGDEPLLIRLSKRIEPVIFGELTVAQLRLLRDAIASWTLPASESLRLEAVDSVTAKTSVNPVLPMGVSRLKPHLQKALDFVKSLNKPAKGVWIAKQLKISAKTFHSHYVGPLRTHGMKNGPDGYYVESS